MQTIDTVLLEGDWEQKQMREILEKFTYEHFKQMMTTWLTTGRMLWYVNGNITKDAAV